MMIDMKTNQSQNLRIMTVKNERGERKQPKYAADTTIVFVNCENETLKTCCQTIILFLLKPRHRLNLQYHFHREKKIYIYNI